MDVRRKIIYIFKKIIQNPKYPPARAVTRATGRELGRGG